MKQIFLRLCAVFVLVAGLFLASQAVQAMTPTLSVSATGSGDSVAITVYGDPYASAILYYQNSGYGMQSQNLGLTNSSGYLSTTVSSSTYGLVAGSSVYAVVNNQTSSSVAWPSSYNNNYNNYNYGNNYGSLTLSQTSASVAVGQAVNITIYGGNTPYTMYPSGANVFQSVISGNSLQVTGLATGTGSLNVCSSGGLPAGQAGTGSGCAVLYVTVATGNYYGGTNYYGGQISLSPSSLSLNSGASSTVTINGNGGYYISSNPNSNIVSAYISGSTVSVSAISYGSDTISICQTGGQCASLYVTVGNGGTNYYPPPVYNNNPVQPAIAFSQNNPALAIGQTMTVSVSSGNTYNYGYYGGNYSIFYNSNSSVLSAVLSGSTLNLQGLANGNVSVVVCSSSTNCSALNVTVGAINYANSGNNYNNSGNWVSCASENGFCSFAGTQNVRYGANGVYVYRTFTNGTTCSNAVFGDPIFGVAKQCSLGGY